MSGKLRSGHTSSYRLKLQYEYLNGQLNRIKDFNAPSTIFWAANNWNAREQLTQETLGNGLVINRSIDADTGWLKSIQTGPGGGSGVQNLAYTWDLVGNLASRKDLNQSNLTETFYYDNLYRLDYSQLNGVTNLDMTYDAMGNITNKSDVGTYYYDATKKHQLSSTTNGWSFSYDSNGNMTSGRGATITWRSYNLPITVTSGSLYASFDYTPDRRYWRQVATYSNGTATTIYIGGILEKVTTAAGTDFRHMIRAGGTTIIVSRQTSGTNTTNYVTSDSLGSSSVITNGSGGILVNSSFDAFGQRRGANWAGSPSAGDWTAIASTTRRGFTDHTMLDNVGLIHMNGRIYDQLAGRVMSSDPYITEPGNTQNFNRYSYVYNNPASNIDPSGFSTAAGRWWRSYCISECMRSWINAVVDQANRANGAGSTQDRPSVANGGGGAGSVPVAEGEDVVVTAALQEEHRCTPPDLASDLWNLFKKKALFDNPIQVDFSAEVIWGVNDFDRMAINLGLNTLGQVVLTGEDASNMRGGGAIVAGSFGFNGGFSNGPAASGAYNVYHREIAGAAGYRGFSFASTSNAGSGSITTPEPPSGGGRGRIGGALKGFRSVGLGLAEFEGDQTQYVSASDPIFDPPQFSGNCP